MNIKTKTVLAGTLILCSLPLTSNALVAQSNNQSSCYTAYHVQQKLDLAVKFGDSFNHQKNSVDVTIHVRDISVSEKDRTVIDGQSATKKNIRSFVFLVRPEAKKDKLIESGLLQRYQHPFVVLMNADSGELIDLKSTVKDPAIMKEYLSFYDLFQYSKSTGEYHYRNGNGYYQANIIQSKKIPGELIRENSGYIKAAGTSENLTQVINSNLTLTLSHSQTDCFYQQGLGTEHFKSTLSANAFVEGDAAFSVNKDATRTLPSNHFFYTLNNQMELWPVFEEATIISKKQAFSKLPKLLSELSDLINDDESFLSAMLLEKESWPYLAEYILQNEITDKLSIELFWALDKINSTESVNALAILATSPLQKRDLFRAVMSLASTTAPFNEGSIELLQNHLINYTSNEAADISGLIYIRMMGAFAQQRNVTAPLQSKQLRNFIYSQADNYDEPANAAIIDAIGNLGSSIDEEGEQILLQNLTHDSSKIRNSSAAAFNRIPYDSRYSEHFIEHINNEDNSGIKASLIEVLGQTNRTDLRVKQQLLSVLQESKNSTINNKSLSSLKKIDYEFQPDEVSMLESKLRQETDTANQRLLASLILKHRQR